MPPVDYSDLSDEEAQRRFDELTSSSPERVAWVRREVGDVLDLTPESLVPLWEWFMRREASRSDRGGELPAWYEPDPPELAPQRLSPATLRDVDAMAHYLAEVFLHNVPGAAWGIGKLPKKMKYAHQNKPVVKLGDDQDANPVGMVYGNAVRVALMGETTPPDTLLAAYRAWVPG
ncbi:MAG TPA: hypothetical protein VFV62_03315 [Gaiellaceae bacterium]|nr:hypothetical protein [Gaiellaceae bacterium]